ncbi:hypothetical protein H0H92_000617 [Tricholoma furcatifolium]|nr:hypothetical protein H0H92_000617 [Tricholoma furcatifolium]
MDTGNVLTVHVHYHADLPVLDCLVIKDAKEDWNATTDVLQVCPLCTSPDAKEREVDLIMGRTLADINTAEDADSLDELLITLPKCGHLFTVETLDGICTMDDYYTRGRNGEWKDLKAPVNESASGERKKPPVCPTCRAAITSPRYGRVFKSADLDILERNVIAQLSAQLEALGSSMDKVSKAELEAKLSTASSTIKAEVVAIAAGEKARKACTKAQKGYLSDKSENPLPTRALQPDEEKLFLISPNVASAWKNAVQPLIGLYNRASKVATMRPPHTKAWEASWSYLVEKELELALADPSRAPRDPHQFAMQMARRKVGQPQPRGDKRFVVEAFWTTIQIRLVLFDLACSWLRSAGKNKNYGEQQLRMWARYTTFILQGCERDARIALHIAQASESRRQMTTSQLFSMRIKLEQHQLNYMLAQESRTIKDCREKLADGVLEGIKEITYDIRKITGEHEKILPGDVKGWIRENFTDMAFSIVEELKALEKSIRCETFYDAVSMSEKRAIFKAFTDFTHAGHFYQCPNGHTYVITEVLWWRDGGRAMP